jgi:hypothetical protein
MAKFKAENTTAKPLKKDFTIPKPGFQTKPVVIISQVGTAVAKKIFINTGVETTDSEIGRSKIFNQPIYADVTFNAGSYTDQNDRTIEYPSLNVQDCLVTVMNTKNIIKTTLQGRNGTVKEYISDGDYSIKIEGKLYGNGMNNYPIGLVQDLHRICKAPQAISITSTFLKMFDVDNIVIESYNIDQMEGIRNYQPFILNCVSDYPLVLLKNA